MLTYQQAYNINQFIDFIHNPYWWSYGAVLALFFGLESYLPKIKDYRSDFEKFLYRFKLSVMLFYSLILIGQGVFGGCIVQIPQNWIAYEYMNKSEWYPYGVVFRELIPSNFWLLLQLWYLGIGIYTFDRCLIFYDKFIKFQEPKKPLLKFLPGITSLSFIKLIKP